MALELNFIHICEKAFLSDTGELNIISDFDELKIENISQSIFFHIVTNFTVDPNTTYRQKISISDKDTGQVVFESQEVEQTTPKSKLGLLLGVNVTFPKKGEFLVNVYINKEVVKTVKLTIS